MHDNICLFLDQIEFVEMRQVLCVESSDAVQFVTPNYLRQLRFICGEHG